MKKSSIISLSLLLVFLCATVHAQVRERVIYPMSDRIKHLYEHRFDSDDFDFAADNTVLIPAHDPNKVWFTDPNGDHTTDDDFTYDPDTDILSVLNLTLSGSMTIASLTADRIVATDASSTLVSIGDLTAWIAGTSNQVSSTADGDGTLTLSLPQNIHSGASPSFTGLTLSGLADTHVLYSNAGVLAGDASFSFNDTTKVVTITGVGGSGLTGYDLKVGDTSTPDYGLIQTGNAAFGRVPYNAMNMDLDGSVIIRNLGAPATSNIEFAFLESGGTSVRFALAKSAVGNATYNPRSMLIAGPAVWDDTIVTVGYWQTNNSIFDNLTCDTSGTGADLGVQNDLEVEGDIFAGSFKESTSGGGITVQPLADSTTFFQVLDADGGTPVFNVDSTNERVGIGIDDPGAILPSGFDATDSVILEMRSRANLGDMGLFIRDGGDGTPGLDIWVDSGVGRVYFNSRFNDTNGDFIFQTRTGGAMTRVMALTSLGRVGMGEEQVPETLLELTSTTPYITLHSDTHEDSDGGRGSRLNFKGEQSGGEETTLARIEVSHDGAADDEKGKVVISTNAGSDTDTPTERLRVDSAGNVGVGATTMDSLFEVDGPQGLAIETVTGNTTLDNTHSTLLVNASGNVIVTLPTAASAYNNTDGIGRIYRVKKIDADADTVTIDGNGAELIDGGAEAVITDQWETISIQTNGTSWYII